MVVAIESSRLFYHCTQIAKRKVKKKNNSVTAHIRWSAVVEHMDKKEPFNKYQ